jgi:hypothetical protein
MDDASRLVGVSEAARQIGVHKSTISRQLAAGIITNRGSKEKPLVDVEEARRARDRGLDRSKQRGPDSPLFGNSSAIAPADEAEPDVDGHGAPMPAKPSGGLDYQKARTAREGYQARLAQIELEQKLGNLLDKGDVVDAFFTMGQRLREVLEQCRLELAARFGDAVGAALAEEFRKLQLGLAEEFERRFVKGEETADAA